MCPALPYRPSPSGVPRQPHELFELFLDVTVIDLLCKHTTTYAVQKGEHSFTVKSNGMRVFIGILLASGYIQVSYSVTAHITADAPIGFLTVLTSAFDVQMPS